MTMESPPPNLLPHEQAVVDLVFTDKSGGPVATVAGSEMAKAVSSSKWNTYKDAVTDELILSGLIDPKREGVTRRYQILALALVVISAVLFVTAFILEDQFGLWPLFLVGAVFLLGLLSFIVSATISARTKQGEDMADAWQPFRNYMDQASKGKEQIASADLFERYLPYAMAFGVAEGWAKQNEKAGWQATPGYFRSLSTDDTASMAAFVVIISSSNNSGGAASAAAAGAAAGAAGGGASGAG